VNTAGPASSTPMLPTTGRKLAGMTPTDAPPAPPRPTSRHAERRHDSGRWRDVLPPSLLAEVADSEPVKRHRALVERVEAAAAKLAKLQAAHAEVVERDKAAEAASRRASGASCREGDLESPGRRTSSTRREKLSVVTSTTASRYQRAPGVLVRLVPLRRVVGPGAVRSRRSPLGPLRPRPGNQRRCSGCKDGPPDSVGRLPPLAQTDSPTPVDHRADAAVSLGAPMLMDGRGRTRRNLLLRRSDPA
jgi:hypothetical protein